MLDAPLVTPEIHPADIAKSQPKTRMHGGVVVFVLPRHRWLVAGDLRAAGGAQVGEMRPRGFRVGRHKSAQRLASVGDHQGAVVASEAQALG